MAIYYKIELRLSPKFKDGSVRKDNKSAYVTINKIIKSFLEVVDEVGEPIKVGICYEADRYSIFNEDETLEGKDVCKLDNAEIVVYAILPRATDCLRIETEFRKLPRGIGLESEAGGRYDMFFSEGFIDINITPVIDEPITDADLERLRAAGWDV